MSQLDSSRNDGYESGVSDNKGNGAGPTNIPIRVGSDGDTPPPAPKDGNVPHDPLETPEKDDDEFDAVRAAEEFTASLGLVDPMKSTEKTSSGYIDILEEEIEKLTALVEEKDQQARAAAVAAREAKEEIAKAAARIEKEAAKQLEQRRRKMLLGFIEVLDDLDRALSAARAENNKPALIEGLELVHSRFLKELNEFGVTLNPSMGETFDPEQHEAVSSVPVTDQAQHNVVIGVIAEGYNIGATALRPARVAVGKFSG